MDDGSHNADLPSREEVQMIRRRRRRWYQKLPPWTHEYGVEIGLVLATLFAIFLLVEPWHIQAWTFYYIGRAFKITYRVVNQYVSAFLDRLTLSNAIAYLILVGVLCASVWRFRWRMLNSERLWSIRCPQCGAPALHRVHRRWYNRLASLLGLPLRRYRCNQCGWRGLRITKHGAVPQPFPSPPGAAARPRSTDHHGDSLMPRT